MNSFVEIDGKYYGASSDGLYLLEGSDDAGAPIDASFGFGQLDFGTPQVKIWCRTVISSVRGWDAGRYAGSLCSRVYRRPAQLRVASGHGG